MLKKTMIALTLAAIGFSGSANAGCKIKFASTTDRILQVLDSHGPLEGE